MINFHDLYQQYAADIYRYSFWLCGDSIEADDLTAETFVRALAGADSIRTETVKAYLLAIARNLYRQRQRHAGRDLELPVATVAEGPTVESRLEQQGELEQARHFLLTLPELDRTVFILRVVEDLLPVYLSGEASKETNRLVEAYLEEDPDLNRLVQKLLKAESDLPEPISGN